MEIESEILKLLDPIINFIWNVLSIWKATSYHRYIHSLSTITYQEAEFILAIIPILWKRNLAPSLAAKFKYHNIQYQVEVFTNYRYYNLQKQDTKTSSTKVFGFNMYIWDHYILPYYNNAIGLLRGVICTWNISCLTKLSDMFLKTIPFIL